MRPAPRGTLGWWLVAAGGAVGTAARAGLTWAWPTPRGSFPWTVFAENVVGALALGVLLGALARREGPDGWRAPLLATGVLGSFTTFSALAVDLSSLAAWPAIALAYGALSAVVGLAAAGLGWRWARGPLPPPRPGSRAAPRQRGPS